MKILKWLFPLNFKNGINHLCNHYHTTDMIVRVVIFLCLGYLSVLLLLFTLFMLGLGGIWSVILLISFYLLAFITLSIPFYIGYCIVCLMLMIFSKGSK